MANYTNQTNISQFLQRSLTANEIATLNGFVLNAVDKWIDRLLETTFANVGETTRYYDGGGRSVDIDPVQAVSAVGSKNNDGSDSYAYTDLTEYVLEPVNETVKREVRKRGVNSRFPRGARRIAVTGKFSEYDYAAGAVPADIIMAATRLAAGVLNAGKLASSGGNVQSESLEGHSISYDTSANALEELSSTDPILQGMIASRREIMIYSEDGGDDDDIF